MCREYEGVSLVPLSICVQVPTKPHFRVTGVPFAEDAIKELVISSNGNILRTVL